MKGQQQVLSTIIISGILIGVVGSVYLWGMPLVQKNEDISIQQNAELFMKSLNEKIKYIANQGGRDNIRINIPGTLKFDGTGLLLAVATEGSIYAIGSPLSLVRNDYTLAEGVWGVDEPELLYVESKRVGGQISTTYTLKYIRLKSGTKSYSIKLSGTPKTSGQNHNIIIENTGTEKSNGDTNTTISVKIL